MLSFHCVCNHVSSCQDARVSSAIRAVFYPVLGSAIFHRSTERPHVLADQHKDRRHLRSWRQTPDRSIVCTVETDVAPSLPLSRYHEPWPVKCRFVLPSPAPSNGVASTRRWILQSQPNNLGYFVGWQPWNARRPGLVAQQPIDASFDIPLLPTPDRRLAKACLPHDLVGANPIASQQNHLGSPDMFLGAIPIGNNRCKSPAIRRRDKKTKVISHAKAIAHQAKIGNLMLQTYH